MRLIDADALLYDLEIVPLTGDGGVDANDIDDIIKRQPTIEERKTGRWKKISPAGIYECDLCGKDVMTMDIDAYDFCHGCGSPMEVEHG